MYSGRKNMFMIPPGPVNDPPGPVNDPPGPVNDPSWSLYNSSDSEVFVNRGHLCCRFTENK